MPIVSLSRLWQWPYFSLVRIFSLNDTVVLATAVEVTEVEAISGDPDPLGDLLLGVPADRVGVALFPAPGLAAEARPELDRLLGLAPGVLVRSAPLLEEVLHVLLEVQDPVLGAAAGVACPELAEGAPLQAADLLQVLAEVV